MQSDYLWTFAVRTCMVTFWLGILVLFLGSSHIMQLCRPNRSINIFSWPVLLDVSFLEQFERETGISINVSYYETNEELFSKLRTTRGAGYDLVIPSDYVVELMIKEGLLQKLDKSKITCWPDLDPKLLGLYCDPGNTYTVPYFWAVYGLGINKTYYNGKLPDASWALIFDKMKAPAAVGMLDAAREAVLLAAFFLFGSSDIAMTQTHIQAIKKLLLDQKAWVSAYTESNVEHLLLSKSCPVVVAMGPDILRIKRTNENIDFVIPKEGSFKVVDSLAIPAKSTKTDLVYQFINYLFRPEVIVHHRSKFGMCCPIKKLQTRQELLYCPDNEQFSKMKYFKTTIPETLLNEIWIQLMAQ